MNRKFFAKRGIVAVLLAITLETTDVGAQSVVFFSNRVLPQPPERRVLMPDCITPVAGTNFMAQLLYGDFGSGLIAHPNIRPFFPSTATALRGYWSGATLNLVTAGPGATVQMQVRVWNAGHGPTPLTFEQAQASGRMFWAVSPIFPYNEEFEGGTDDKWMKNFTGGCWLLTPIPLHFGSVSPTGGHVRFSVQGYYDRVVIETKTDLATSAAWLPIYTNPPPFWFTNATTDDDRRFFRAVGMYDQ